MENKISVRQALNIALREELEHDDRVFIIGEEVGRNNGAYGVTQNLYETFGKNRVIDMPITEYGFTGMAIGAAFTGLKPIVEYMTMNFSLQAIDHIINSSAKTLYMSGGSIKNSVVFRGPNGFAYGVGAQHTHNLSVFFGSVPGLKVVAPFSALDHKGCLKKAIRDKNPVVFLENEVLYDEKFPMTPKINDKNYFQEFKCVIEKEGNDLTMIGISLSVKICLEAAEVLEKKGISIEIINLVSIRPLDMKTLNNSVKKTRRVVIVDLNWKHFSVSSEISASLSENLYNALKCPVLRICAEGVPTPYSHILEREMYPNVEKVVRKVSKMFNK